MDLLRRAGNLKGLYCGLILCLFSPLAIGIIGPQQVLILVNQNSPASRYIANLYIQYHPEINTSQILYLHDDPNFPQLHLHDCCGETSMPQDEILSRAEYETLIAKRVRRYLVQNNKVNSIYLIITTAGLPYRIADSTYSYIVTPAGGGTYSNGLVASIDAASVESELAVLFQNDPNSAFSVGAYDRVVNPYQGYRNSGIQLFTRNILENRSDLSWKKPRKLSASHYPPWMEGVRARNDGVQQRNFSAGDIYLTCRLDGPKRQGETAIEAVHNMLERAKRASNPAFGINPNQATVIFDDATSVVNLNYNRIYNLNKNVNYINWQAGVQQPPDTTYAEYRDDYDSGYFQMTGQNAVDEICNTALMPYGHNLQVICDKRINFRFDQSSLSSEKLILGLDSYGTNGDEGNNKFYLLTGGPDNGPLFNMANGAVFCSMESFNAVTMFSDASSAQAKIIDFITIGGTTGIGHSFEPISDATIDSEFLFYNMLADSDGDGYADLTFIEAAFTAIPYLSWSEVVIGDPLMRIAYGPGGQAVSDQPGDIDGNGQINITDFFLWTNSYLGSISSDQAQTFDEYNDLCDLNKDGKINFVDFASFLDTLKK